MTRAALYLAALFASAVAWRRPSREQTSIAVALAALLAIDCTRPFLASVPALYVGLFPAWFGVSTWAVARVLDPSGPRTGQAFAMLAASSGVVLTHGATAALARASFALALVAQLLAALRFAARGRSPDDAQRVALILTASSLADVAGPWLAGHASRDWYAGKWPAVITWIVVATWEGICLIRRR